jgi:hypothetical protein
MKEKTKTAPAGKEAAPGKQSLKKGATMTV